MGGYWSNVPRGVWKILDPEDAIQALEDPESRADYDANSHRINILGPFHKGIIIDLPNILEALDYSDKLLFIGAIEKLLNCQIKV